jgi:hypothetical protein
MAIYFLILCFTILFRALFLFLPSRYIPCPHTNTMQHISPSSSSHAMLLTTITHHHHLLCPLVSTPCPLGFSLVTPQMLPTIYRLPPTGNTSSACRIDGTHSTLQVKSSKCPKFSYPVLLHVPHSHFCAGANGANG